MAKVTSKLQVTIPKRIAEKHGIRPGDQIRFESVGATIRVVPEGGRGEEALSVAERLRLFDAASGRIRQRAQALPLPADPPPERDWTRDELYDRDRQRRERSD